MVKFTYVRQNGLKILTSHRRKRWYIQQYFVTHNKIKIETQ